MNASRHTVKRFIASESRAKSFEEIPRLNFFERLGLYKAASESKQHVYVSGLKKKYGDIFRLEIPMSKPRVLIWDPSDVETLLRNDGKYPVEPGFDVFVFYRRKLRPDLYPGCKGLFGSHYEEWLTVRNKVNKIMLRKGSVLYHLDDLLKSSESLVQLFERKKTGDGLIEDITPYMRLWALESVGLVFLDTELGCLQDSPTQHGKDIIEGTSIALGFDLMVLNAGPLIWRKFRTPHLHRFDKASEKIQRATIAIIDQAVEEFDVKEKKNLDKRQLSILQQLIMESDDDSDLPRVMAMDAIFAGVDTSGTTSTMLLYHLASNPEAQERLHDEITGVVGSEKVSAAHIDKMRFLKACQRESQRIFPAIFGILRKTNVDMVLSGYTVPANSIVQYFSMLNSNSSQHFTNPQQFNPDRFTRGSASYQENNPFANIPFGHGPRMCIGRRIAELELYTLVIAVLKKYRLEFAGDSEPGLLTPYLSRPDRKIGIKFIPRN